MKTEVIESWLRGRVAEALRRPAEEMDWEIPLTRLGLDSLALFNLTGELAQWLGRDLPASLAWEHPTISALAQHLESSTPEADTELMPPAPRDRPLRLTPVQEEVWRMSRVEKYRLSYQHIRGYALRGPLHVEALRRCVNEIVRRHEILRTTFAEVEGAPAQIVHPAVEMELAEIELARGEQELARFEKAAQAAPMDLEKGPLFRAQLVRLGAEEHRLYFLLHHLVYDAQSLIVLHRELGDLYAAFRHGLPSPLPALLCQMADFAAWERARLDPAGEVHSRQLAWWKEHWSGPSLTPVRFCFQRRQRSTTARLEEGRLTWEVPPALFAQLEARAREEGATLYATLFAAFIATLYEHGGQEEFAVGTNVSNRSCAAAKDLIGYFINRLVLRAEVRGGVTFRKLLGRVRATLEQASAHSELPWHELTEILKLEGRELPRPSAVFQYIKNPEGTLQLDGLEVRPLWEENPLTQMPWGLSLTMRERAGKLLARMSLNAASYEPAQVSDMFQRYGQFLEAVAANAETPLPKPRPTPKRFWFWPAS